VRRLLLGVALAAACAGEPEVTPPNAGSSRPLVRGLVPVARESVAVSSPLAAPLRPEVEAARLRLLGVVSARGLDPALPWATGHALLALGPEARMADGRLAVDHLVTDWARLSEGDAGPELQFPKLAGKVPVEPHSELMLKVFTDIGVSPTRPVRVGGREVTLEALYRGALRRTWLQGQEMSFVAWNDVPWAVHALALWSPPGAAWTSSDGHRTLLSTFTDALVRRLVEETAFMAAARASGAPLVKQGQGLFSYTCGGAHLLQGAATAVGAGFGSPEATAAVREQSELLRWRFDQELRIVDEARQQHPEYELILLVQRLKFVGHYLETMHRFAALDLMAGPDDAVRASLRLAEDELVRTVAALEALGVFERLDAIRAEREQTYLDLIGDAAHAVNGLNLASGAASARR
jgi:hypothetical protein